MQHHVLYSDLTHISTTHNLWLSLVVVYTMLDLIYWGFIWLLLLNSKLFNYLFCNFLSWNTSQRHRHFDFARFNEKRKYFVRRIRTYRLGFAGLLDCILLCHWLGYLFNLLPHTALYEIVACNFVISIYDMGDGDSCRMYTKFQYFDYPFLFTGPRRYV